MKLQYYPLFYLCSSKHQVRITLSFTQAHVTAGLDLLFYEQFHYTDTHIEAVPVQSSSALQYTRIRALSPSVLSTPTTRKTSVWIFKTASLKFLLSRKVAQISQVLRTQELPDKVAPILVQCWMFYHHISPYTYQVKSQITLKQCLLVIKGFLKANSKTRCWNWSYQSQKL